ncbi:hypothetical protein E2C01_003921 [Portunus trituberculatus]|uniref:Uncharacterized protein n=1 Tax=Portunus trituberculatus TaxID=210409 RepID=A0A5B7CP87_PORTR|nr:hypothetical protein [Portunus trituberculatus]
MEEEFGWMREMTAGILENQDQLFAENEELKVIYKALKTCTLDPRNNGPPINGFRKLRTNSGVRFNLQTNIKMRTIVRSWQIIVRYVVGRSRHQLLATTFNLQSMRFQPTANIVQCLPRLFYAFVPFPQVLNLSKMSPIPSKPVKRN